MDVCIQNLKEALDRLAEAGPLVPADAASVEELISLSNQMEAVVTESVASFDASGEWALDGARTAAAWVSTRCRMPAGAARHRVHLGRRLSDLPHCTRAWSAGEINAAHVSAIAALSKETTKEALERDEAVLVDQAKALRFGDFTKVIAYWEQHADPDGTEEAAEKRRAQRDVFLAPSFQGTYLGKMNLDPISGTIVGDELARLERQLFEADWNEATETLGREPKLADLARTSAQRRADALVEMATRSKMAPEHGQRPAPLFSVLVGYETMHGPMCQLAQGTVVTPGSLLSWLDEAYVERAVFHPGGKVEVSATARLFTGATRRAIELRDRECTHPYCDIPAPDCQVDHIIPFAEGGPTTQDNGRLLCGAHNRMRNQRPPPDS
ncbi:MAG TPA: DUF222 domain-containing protein [Acidimicrobiales bacterium]|nr:DUF222 domain-containing protein [Acidimicrobiales bacterium]